MIFSSSKHSNFLMQFCFLDLLVLTKTMHFFGENNNSFLISKLVPTFKSTHVFTLIFKSAMF